MSSPPLVSDLCRVSVAPSFLFCGDPEHVPLQYGVHQPLLAAFRHPSSSSSHPVAAPEVALAENPHHEHAAVAAEQRHQIAGGVKEKTRHIQVYKQPPCPLCGDPKPLFDPFPFRRRPAKIAERKRRRLLSLHCLNVMRCRLLLFLHLVSGTVVESLLDMFIVTIVSIVSITFSILVPFFSHHHLLCLLLHFLALFLLPL